MAVDDAGPADGAGRRRKLVLHAGPHKTGSSALQLRLLTATEWLASQGWVYPRIGMRQFGQHGINAFLNGRDDALEPALAALAADGQNVILSSEDLVYQPVERLRKLRDVLDGFAIEPVLFIRDPVGLWPSHWQELVKHGRSDTLLDYVGGQLGLNGVIDPRPMNPLLQAAKFAEAFGRNRLRLVCYDNIQAEGHDIFGWFVEHVLELPLPADFLATIQVNTALPWPDVELLRCLNEGWRTRHGRSPGSDLTGAWSVQRRALEQSDGYRAFLAAFAQAGRSLVLDGDNALLRQRNRQIAKGWGDRIENAAGERLFAQTVRQEISYGEAFWADRAGLRPWLDELAEALAAPAG